MKGVKDMPGLIRPAPSLGQSIRVIEWTFREWKAQRRWSWYRARRPMAFVWAVPPSMS